MIWLPGVLSQGGEKYVWQKYTVEYVQKAGSQAVATIQRRYQKYHSTTYSFAGQTFTLTNAIRNQMWNVDEGEYLVDIQDKNSDLISGTTLYEVVSISEDADDNLHITYIPYTAQATKGSFVDTVEDSSLNAYPSNGEYGGYWYVLTDAESPGTGIKYVEYIESTGTQYIDTGFKPNQNTRVVMDAQYTSVPTRSACLFGARKASGSVDFSLWYVPGSSVLQSGYANTKPTAKISDITARHVYDKNKNVLYLDGTSFVSSAARTFQSAYNLFLFESDQLGVAQGYGSSVKHWSCKIYDNGVLIRDYRPCIDPDGVVCVYDEVNQEYVYNAGTGVFIAGDPIGGDIPGGDVPEEGEFSFTIDNETFYADAGMTWAEWVNSAYNTAGAYIDSSGYVFCDGATYVLVTSKDYEYVSGSDTISAVSYNWITTA